MSQTHKKSYCSFPLFLLSFFLLLLNVEALIRVAFDPDGLKMNRKYYIQNKEKKGGRMGEVLIVPQSAGLFLINLDHIFVLHPQLQ